MLFRTADKDGHLPLWLVAENLLLGKAFRSSGKATKGPNGP
jgi:hypothetical protein